MKLASQFIHELIHNKEIWKLVDGSESRVYTEEEITRIIEEDEELDRIVEEIKSLDCGCDNSSPTSWSYPGICLLLVPLFMISFAWLMLVNLYAFFNIMISIGYVLNCFWLPV